MKSHRASRRLVRSPLDERGDRTTRTLDGHRNLRVVAVQYRPIDQQLVVDGVACEANHGVATHCAVSLVVHENGRQIGVTCTDKLPNEQCLSQQDLRIFLF